LSMNYPALQTGYISTDEVVVIQLVQFPAGEEIPNYSPFCLKVELCLKVNGIHHELVPELNPRVGPRGKLPFIIHEGKKVSDSDLILDYLESHFDLDLQQDLCREKKGIGHAVEVMCNEHLYFLMMYFRYFERENFKLISRIFFSGLAFPINKILPQYLYSTVKKQLHFQGTGRLTRDEVTDVSRKTIDSLEGILGEQNFFTGPRLSRADYTAFAHLANILYPPFESPLRDYLKTKERLVKYCDRINSYYF